MATRVMKMRFYLFDESVAEFSDCIRLKQLEEEVTSKSNLQNYSDSQNDPSASTISGKNFRQLRLSNEVKALGFEAEAWVLEKNEVPEWFTFIRDYIDDNDLSYRSAKSNSIYGLLVLIKLHSEKRIFAISFGYGYALIQYTKLESGFGRRVALNSISRNGLRTLDVHNIDLVTRQKRIHVNRQTDTTDFRLDGEDVVVTGVIGIPESTHNLGGGQIEGTESLRLSLEDSLKSIGDRCRQLLDLNKADNFKNAFPELTRLLPISGSRIQSLDEQLFAALNQESIDNISLAIPTLDYAFGISYFEVYNDQNLIGRLHDFEIGMLYKDLKNSRENNWSTIKVKIYQEGNNTSVRSFRLLDSLIFLYEESETSYLYTFGSWYEITQDYQAWLDKQLVEIPSVNNLPSMSINETEEQYNKRVAKENSYCYLDRNLIRLGNRNRIEPADFVTHKWEFVCVKKASKNGNQVHSSTLSHLFAQGSTAAILLAKHSEYRQQLLQVMEQCKLADTAYPFSRNAVTEGKITFVYAIAINSDEEIIKRLPLFSKITLRNHVEEIRKLGFQVQICKIDLK